ncbi:MAG: arginase family protein [Bacteroidales bacterium]|nr:arginase family protein [Bacteroidales bacterium]MBN2633048.1 arginase family protein [Bacteroidales bacterium]
MIELNDYFDPVSIESPEPDLLHGNAGFPHSITVNTPGNGIRDISKYRIALFGVPEGRNSPGPGTANGPDAIRKELYRLSRIPGRSKIADLGNMKKGVSFNDTVAGLSDILVFLLERNIFPVIIGGSSALALAVDKAFSALKIQYTLTAIDPRIDYNIEKKDTDSYNYLNAIINNHKSTFIHYVNIGYQTYLNDQQVINRFLKRKAELMRTGDVRKAIYLTEPLLRDSDAVLLDISSVRQADAPGTTCPSPNGFYGEEICLLSRYSGISDNLKLFALFEVNPEFDNREQTAGLAAQIIWFFFEGFSQKQYENPSLSGTTEGRFIRYHVRVSDLEEDLIFIKSNLTDRWWMEFPAEAGRFKYIACSHEDYLKANRDEVPERWIQGSKRIKTQD